MRGTNYHYAPPTVISTSENASNYFKVVHNLDLDDVASRYEAYCIAGINGVVKNYVDQVVELKSRTSEFILRALRMHSASSITCFFY